jgi:hypothetical protein
MASEKTLMTMRAQKAGTVTASRMMAPRRSALPGAERSSRPRASPVTASQI